MGEKKELVQAVNGCTEYTAASSHTQLRSRSLFVAPFRLPQKVIE